MSCNKLAIVYGLALNYHNKKADKTAGFSM